MFDRYAATLLPKSATDADYDFTTHAMLAMVHGSGPVSVTSRPGIDPVGRLKELALHGAGFRACRLPLDLLTPDEVRRVDARYYGSEPASIVLIVTGFEDIDGAHGFPPDVKEEMAEAVREVAELPQVRIVFVVSDEVEDTDESRPADATLGQDVTDVQRGVEAALAGILDTRDTFNPRRYVSTYAYDFFRVHPQHFGFAPDSVQSRGEAAEAVREYCERTGQPRLAVMTALADGYLRKYDIEVSAADKEKSIDRERLLHWRSFGLLTAPVRADA